jgi:hypothetical protein
VTEATTRPEVRWPLRLDAALETVLAAMCVVLAYGLLGTDQWKLPSWLSTPVLLVVGVLLLLAAVILWRLSGRPDAAAVRTVAIANGVTILIFVLWAIIGLGAGTQLRILLTLTAILLGALAVMQYGQASRPIPRT